MNNIASFFNGLWGVARLTIVEVRRNRAMHAAVLVMLMLLIVSSALASVTMGKAVDIIVDFGMASISLIGNMIAIVLSVQLTQQERENRTLYLLLPRIASRSIYMAGKFVGLAVALAGLTGILLAMLYVFASSFGWDNPWSLLLAGFATLIELWLVAALALLFSNASSLFLAIFLTITVDLAGRFTLVIKQFGESVGGPLEWFTDAVYYVLPNFELINLRTDMFNPHAISWDVMLSLTAYGLTEIGMIVSLACLLFMRRDIQA